VNAAGYAGLGGAIQLLTLKKGMEQEAVQMAQLLQSLPPAPSPETHKGQNVDVSA
jgi:hypothetical protein